MWTDTPSMPATSNRPDGGRNVTLIGFMGSGKSSVGRTLAAWTGREFVDTDALIERRAGKTIPQIFADDGEEAFRDLESEAVAQATRRRGCVIATGGGAPMRERNRRALRESGAVVFLNVEPETIFRRIGKRRNAAASRGGEPDRTSAGAAARAAPGLSAGRFRGRDRRADGGGSGGADFGAARDAKKRRGR